MKYRYSYKHTPSELWQLSMYYVYGSVSGIVNIIATIAFILLAIKRWDVATMPFRAAFVFFALWFPVLHPLLIYIRCKRDAESLSHKVDITIDDKGLHVTQGKRQTRVPWKDIKKVAKKPTMIIIFPESKYGYVLTNRIIGDDRDRLYLDVKEAIEKSRPIQNTKK